MMSVIGFRVVSCFGCGVSGGGSCFIKGGEDGGLIIFNDCLSHRRGCRCLGTRIRVITRDMIIGNIGYGLIAIFPLQ